MSQPSSYLATLERHRKTFAVMEEHQEAVEQLLELTRRLILPLHLHFETGRQDHFLGQRRQCCRFAAFGGRVHGPL